jgi:phospholipid/cholesterol/gamma-HCH transport system substrate-binding protein
MNFRAPILVGLLLLSAASATTWFIVSTSKDKYDDDSTIHLFADFSDASGIRWKTRIQINGIDVGKIDGVEHVQRDDGTLMARVKVRVLKKYAIYQNAVIRKAAESLLGDFRLDLTPGTSDSPRLEAGGIIQKVQSISDMEEIQNELKQVAHNINRITDSFQSVLTGPAGEGSLQAILSRMEKSMEAIEKTTQTLSLSLERNNHHINNTLRNIDRFSSQLVGVMSEGGALGEVTSNAAQLTQRLNTLTGKLTDALTGNEAGLAESSPLGASINNLNESIEHLNSIASKVDNGQGTAGRLINDAGIAEKVEQTLDDTNEIIGSLSKLETQVELRTEYGVPFDGDNELVQKAIKNTLSLRLVPRPDKYYILEAVADPRGLQTRTITTSDSTGTTPENSVTEVNETTFNQMKFSVQMAKRYYFLGLRFGIIENTGGLGIDLFSLGDKLELRFDAFDFDRRDPKDNVSIFPRLRGAALFEAYNHIYVQAGVDDPLNEDLKTWFLGGVLRFTDEDLKTFLTVAPF